MIEEFGDAERFTEYRMAVDGEIDIMQQDR
jgi:hypothetical protein